MEIIKKIKKKFTPVSFQAGMTYVELIVVLSIFAVMTSVVLFNYNAFQGKVDLKNLANQIALKVVEAQKAAMSGQLSPQRAGIQNWHPAYGVYFDLTSPGDDHTFIYYVDATQDNRFWNAPLSFCPQLAIGECMDKISITKGNRISDITVFYLDGTSASVNNIGLTFTRPNSEAVASIDGVPVYGISYTQITVSSPNGATAAVKVFSSGRIQIN